MKRGQEHGMRIATGMGGRCSAVWGRFSGWLTVPVEALPLRVFEIWFAVTFPARLTRNFPIAEWLTTEGYHVTPAQWRGLGYPEAFPLLPLWGAWLFIAVVFLAVAGLAFDLRRRRLWLGILLASAIYAQGVDYLAATSANKQFIVVFFILFTGPGLWRCQETGRWMVSAATMRALQGTLLVIYFSSGWAKAFTGDWLKYSDVIYTQVQGSHRTEFAAWALRHWPLWFWTLNQHLALVFELGAPLLLGVRKLRPIGFVLGAGMHLIIALTMFQLIYFSTQMWAYYALFVSAEQWRVVGRLPGPARTRGWAALAEAARRFWEGWMGAGWRPGLPAWAKEGLARLNGPAVYGVAMLGVWLIPFFWTGWKGRSLGMFPRWWSFQHSAAGLFTRRTTVWWDHHLEAQFQGASLKSQEAGGSRGEGQEGAEEEHGRPRPSQEAPPPPAPSETGAAALPGVEGARETLAPLWVELQERAFFPMGAFGFRTRFDRILNESQRSRLRDPIRERLAGYVVEKMRDEEETGQAGSLPGLGEVQIVRSLWRVGEAEMARPAGAWNPPEVTRLGASQRTVLGAYRVEADGGIERLKERETEGQRARAAGTPREKAVSPNRGGAPSSRPAEGAVANERIRAAKAMVERLRAQGRLPEGSAPGKAKAGQAGDGSQAKGRPPVVRPGGAGGARPPVLRPPGTRPPVIRPPVMRPQAPAGGAPKGKEEKAQ